MYLFVYISSVEGIVGYHKITNSINGKINLQQ